MRYLRNISRIFVGIIFVFSGFVKAVDPLGSAYKFGDYFSAFGLNFLHPFALPLAIILSSVELTMGVAFLLSYRMKFFNDAVLVFMAFFTVITLMLAIYNPVTDCGCFGDALILTNWETFFKNIVILLVVLFIFSQRKKFLPVAGKKREWTVIAVVFGMASYLSVYALNHLPPLDFRPFSIGSDIPQKMIIPPDAQRDVYETKLIYRNKETGVEEEFSVENFPKDTMSYSFVDAISKLTIKGYEPPVHDFTITSRGGVDVTDLILQDKEYSFLLISHNLSDANKEGLLKAEEFARFARVSDNLNFYCLTSSGNQIIEETLKVHSLSYEFYQVDEITLKTIIRSNPGLVLLKNGIVIGKWHFNDFPEPEQSLTGNNYKDILDSYPFSPGTNLSSFDIPPPGATQDQYETTLFYRNILTDSITAFTIDDFPQSKDWVFVNSASVKVREGFLHPLKDFTPTTPEGLDISRNIVTGQGNVFIVLCDKPEEIDNELLERVNRLSIISSTMDTAHFSFFGVTGLEKDELIDFTQDFVSPIHFASLKGDLISRIAGNGIALIWIKNNVVMSVSKNYNIPEPASFRNFLSSLVNEIDAEKFLIPTILDSYRKRIEKGFVYLFIFGLILFGLLLRVYFEEKKSG